MGRSKAAPIRRESSVNGNEDDNTELLGRRGQDHGGTSLEQLLVREFLFHNHRDDHDDDDNSDDYKNNDLNEMGIHETFLEGRSANSLPSSKQRRKRQRRTGSRRNNRQLPPQKISKKNDKKKAVHFPNDSKELATIIPPPEVQLTFSIHEDGTDDVVMSDTQQPPTTTHLQYNWDACEVDNVAVWIRSFSLVQTTLSFTVVDSNTSMLESNRTLKLQSPRGIMDLWHRYQLVTGNNSDQLLFLAALIQSTKDGTLVIALDINLSCSSSDVTLKVGLTSRAMEICHPTALPFGYRTKSSANPRFQSVRNMYTVLQALVDGDVECPYSPNFISKDHAITAKDVYDLTDNRQLERALSSSKNGSYQHRTTTEKTIPGLLPTLRGYQQHAVSWMLDREQNPKLSVEWELAWMVAHFSCDAPNNSVPARLQFLPRFRLASHAISADDEDVVVKHGSALYVCPVTGWLAMSYDEARDMTMSSMTITSSMTTTETGASACTPDVVKGGILAESMGLGKTVEVLACILGNPRPIQDWQQPAATIPSPAQRQLQFESESADEEDEGTSAVVKRSSSPTVGVVEDMREFGDAQDSSDDDESVLVGTQRVAVAADDANNNSATTTIRNAADEHRLPPIPVTPEKEKVVAVEEVWVDDPILGSCICGQLIGFDHPTKFGPVIVCDGCQEPMHEDCAYFPSGRITGEPLRYRQRITNRSINCMLCDESYCPCCVAKSGIQYKSHATLIITPPAILNQWEREIQQHARSSSTKGGGAVSLRTLVYSGLESTCRSSAANKSQAMKILHPRYMGDADIILTTFDALMGDLSHSNENRFVAAAGNDDMSGYLRYRKRYRAIPSPLLSIAWWRVCLDEAQRVETPTAASSRMALKLVTEHRWCVSGTPVGRGKLEDLYGLLLFLGVEPFCRKEWFTKALRPASSNVNDRIAHLLQHVFWRSTKAHPLVLEQMGVPEQIETKVILRASSIEKHFYDRQLEWTLATVSDIAESENQGKKRKSSKLDLLAENLHRLRAACCHPQVGSSGIASIKRSRSMSGKKASTSRESSTIGSRVMTMDQILDRFIDDAKLKCEEAQRLTIMHTNAMAAVSRLKVEAKERRISIPESDEVLLTKSCKLYIESLSLAEENGKPTLVVGEATLTGSPGFCFPNEVFRRGSTALAWKAMEHALPEPWGMLEFEGPSRKITEIRLQPVTRIPPDVMDATAENFQWLLLRPKACVFQVASSALGGAYVDVASVFLPDTRLEPQMDGAWIIEGGFRTNKSKTWRVVIKSFYDDGEDCDCGVGKGMYCGLSVELFEADIASDPLQTLHALHNALLSFESLRGCQCHNLDALCRSELSEQDITSKIQSMTREADKIETLYMELARSTHSECKRRLQESSSARQVKQDALLALSEQSKTSASIAFDAWEDEWWDDFLVATLVRGSAAQQQSICERLLHELDGMLANQFDADGLDRDKIKFPEFADLSGFRTALQMRLRNIRTGLGTDRSRTSRISASTDAALTVDDPFAQPRSTRFKCSVGQHGKCMQAILNLSERPSQAEVYENSHCQVCKADWFQTGPKCSHCIFGDVLRDLAPDVVTVSVLSALHGIVRSPIGSTILKSVSTSASVSKRAKLFFDVLEAERKEKALAYRTWRVHLDLLNDLDELNQCKTSMRLTLEGEDLTQLAADQLNAVVSPVDLNAKYYDHAGKQAMSHGELRRSKDLLRYLRNLTEHQQQSDAASDDICSVCQETLDADKLVAVLKCGHRFCLQPCLEQLKARRSGLYINCPMRCQYTTDPDAVMIATSKSKADGSTNHRSVKGSWGTKVTRLVADVLDIRDKGEKGVVFSQWEDMLDIVQQALLENGVEFVRASSAKRIGESVKRFRSECTVLLLNVKNGAEGLTLLEATHIFMVEPLLNCGLDSQAINRVHRIGQTKKTRVWRYLMEDTIEMKIDQMRMEHQGQQLEDSLSDGRKFAFKAGGIDGGFQTQEELLDLLR